MKKNGVTVILVFILLLGANLRLHNFTVWPREGATFDEFAWTFLGISLWESGVPTSWSPHSAYNNRQEYFNPQGARFTLVTPYLEHPPLFGLIVGGYARLVGVTSFDDVAVDKIRPLAIVLGIFAIYTVFLLTSSLYGNHLGLIASFLYAIVPSVVIGSRIVQNENFFIPWFLLALYFGYTYLSSNKRLYFVATVLICSLLPLAKIPWIAAPLAVFGMFIYAKKWKAAGIIVVASIVGLLLYFIYGVFLDTELFLDLWRLQLNRYDMSFDSFFLLFRDSIIVDRTFVDGWIYVGWAAMLIMLTKNVGKNLPVVFGFLAYSAIYVTAIPGEPLHGWYRYPFYPLLVIAIAVFLKENLNKQYFAMAGIFILTGLSMLAETWGKTFGFSYTVLRFYLAFASLGSLGSFVKNGRLREFFDRFNYVIMSVVILLTIWAVRYYNEQ